MSSILSERPVMAFRGFVREFEQVVLHQTIEIL